MKDIGMITGLLVISLASLTFSYPPQYQNGLTNASENYVPSINGGFINQILKSILDFIHGVLAQLHLRNPEDDENRFNKNGILSNDKFNGPNHIYNDDDSSMDELSDIGNTNIENNNGKSLNSNINTIDGRSFVNGGEYEIFKGGNQVLDLPSGTYTGLKKVKQLKGKERQMAEEAVKKQNNGSLTFSGPLAATDLSDSHESNESQYSDEEPLVKPKIEITKNGRSGNKIGNVDMSGKSDTPKPRNIPNINIGGRGYPYGVKDKTVNMGGIDSNGNNTGIKSISNFGNRNVKNKEDVIENHENINCDAKTLQYNNKTYVDSEYEIQKGGKINITTKISKLQLKGLKIARKLTPKEVEWVKEKLKSCYENTVESLESEESADVSEDYDED